MTPALDARATVTSPRDAIITSVRTNRAAIVLSVGSLVLLIDEKLASIRNDRGRNDKKAQAEEIAHYERLKQDVEALRKVTLNEKASAKTVEKAANKFVQRIQDWWEKDYEKICNKAFDIGLFTLSVGICSLVDSGGPIAVAVSGALIGGKPIIDALKAIPKRFK